VIKTPRTLADSGCHPKLLDNFTECELYNIVKTRSMNLKLFPEESLNLPCGCCEIDSDMLYYVWKRSSAYYFEVRFFMNNIGQRIKELRRKNDLTQESLADFLGITDKAVSKWECGLTIPDLALIGPLTKIFHVSADELLGLTIESTDARRVELEENLRQAWIKGGELDGFELVYKAEEDLVREYPGDMKILCDFAWTMSNRAIHMDDRETEILKAVRRFETVIENTDDEKVRSNAIQGIVQSLTYIGLYDEAKKYAERLPNMPAITKDSVLEHCLRGKDLLRYRQQKLDTTLHSLLVFMERSASDKLRAIEDCEKILQIIIPDGIYLEYHCNLAELAYKKARICMEHKMYSDAVDALKKYKEHSVNADRADVHKEELRYTSMYLDLIVLPPNVPQEMHNLSYSKSFEIQIQDEIFDPLRECEDFKALLNN